MKLSRENRSARIKICPNAALSTTSFTWAELGSNRGRMALTGENRSICPNATLYTANIKWTLPGIETGSLR